MIPTFFDLDKGLPTPIHAARLSADLGFAEFGISSAKSHYVANLGLACSPGLSESGAGSMGCQTQARPLWNDGRRTCLPRATRSRSSRLRRDRKPAPPQADPRQF